MTQNTHNPKFNSLKKHETLSKDFTINKKRKDASDFNRDNFELLKIDWSMSYDIKLPSPTTVVTSVFQSDSSLSDGKNARGCHNHQAGRLHTFLIELNSACHDVIFSPSDNSLSDGKHACPMNPLDPSDNLTFTRLPQSPARPLARIPNRIKPCLS